MVLFLCRNKSSQNDLKLHGEYFWNTGERIKARGPTPCPRGWEARLPPWARPPASWAPWCSTDLNSNSIYSRSGRKKIREKDSSHFTIRSRRQALISLGRADRSPFGAPERGIRHRPHHQPSSITNFMMLTVVRE